MDGIKDRSSSLTYSHKESLKKLRVTLSNLKKVASQRDSLETERVELRRDALEIHAAIKKIVSKNYRFTVPSVIAATELGAYATSSVIGGSIGDSLGLIGLKLIRPYLHFALLEYVGLLFDMAEMVCDKGRYTVIENKPKEGIFRVQFYGPLWTNAEPMLNVWIQADHQPAHRERIQEINSALNHSQAHIDSLKARSAGVQAKIDFHTSSLLVTQFEHSYPKPLESVFPEPVFIAYRPRLCIP